MEVEVFKDHVENGRIEGLKEGGFFFLVFKVLSKRAFISIDLGIQN